MLVIFVLLSSLSSADMFSDSGTSDNLQEKNSTLPLPQPPQRPQASTTIPAASLDDTSTPSESDSLKVFVGKCAALESFLPKLDEFMSQNPGLNLTLLMMVSDGNAVSAGLKGKELHYAGAQEVEELKISKVPTSVITKSGVTYKVVGDVDISDYKRMKVSEKTDRFVLLGDEGSSCPARPMMSRSDAEVRAMNPQSLKLELPTVSAPSVPLPQSLEAKQFKVDVPVLASVPSIKLAVFSHSDMPWAKDLLAKGYQGCCTDCSTFAAGISACSAELLTNLRVNSVPARIDIDFKTGKALVREGK